MKVLVLGSGAREHTIAWALHTSSEVDAVLAGPGNAGTAEICTNLWDLDPLDTGAVAQECRRHSVDLVFVGPETPLEIGVVDDLAREGISAIGPGREAARLECSKTFSKNFMLRHGVPTADANTFTDVEAFEGHIRSTSGMRVVKKSGLAAGKGVLESADDSALLEFGREILASDELLVEEYLTGYEISVFALLDSRTFILLPPCADYKKVGEGDTGPNTGGMGAICPVPRVGAELLSRLEREIVVPTVEGLRQDGILYTGVLFFGLMITADGPRVIEYNVRFGDPETQVLLPALEWDFGKTVRAMQQGNLAEISPAPLRSSCLGVVIAAGGYPGSYKKGLPVTIDHHGLGDALVFHASTRVNDAGDPVTGGGRCFSVVGRGATLRDAAAQAYSAVPAVGFPDCFHRRDIGRKFFQEDR